jgi:hypothetical protein
LDRGIGREALYSTNSSEVTLLDCRVIVFNRITVVAGNFDAFECECQCTILSAGYYESGCDAWTIWYAPAVKNIINKKATSHLTFNRTAIGDPQYFSTLGSRGRADCTRRPRATRLKNHFLRGKICEPKLISPAQERPCSLPPAYPTLLA